MRNQLTKFFFILIILGCTQEAAAACDVFPVTVEVCDDGTGTGFLDLTSYNETINGNTGNAVFWWQDANATLPVTDPTNTQISGADLWVTVTDGVCTSVPTLIPTAVLPQPPAFPASLEACADVNGQGNFDLSGVNETVNGGSGSQVTYFLDASLMTEITNPNAFVSFQTTVYAQVTDGSGCTSGSVAIDLVVVPSPFAVNADLHGCDDGTGQALFNLTGVESTIQGGTGNTVLWFSDISLTNPIADPSAFLSIPADVYAVVDNGVCISNVATVNLFVDPVPTVDNAYITVSPESGCGLTIVAIQFFFPGDGNYDITLSYGNADSGYQTYTGSESNFGIVQVGFDEPTEIILTSVEGETNCVVNFPVPDTILANIFSEPDLAPDGPPPVFCEGDEIDLSSISISDQNNSGVPIQFHSALPATAANLIDPPVITATPGQTVYAVADGGPGCADDLEIPLVIEQAPSGVSIPYFGCDQGDGTGIFDLTQNEDLIGFATFLPILWYGDADLTQPIADPSTYVGPTGVVYAVVDGPVCDSDPVQIQLTVEPAPTIDNAFVTVDDGPVCGDGIYTVIFNLPGSDAYTVTMDYGNPSDGFQEYIGVNVYDGSQVPFIVDGDATFILTSVTVQSNNACSVLFDPPVVVNAGTEDSPDLAITEDPLICTGLTVDLSAYVTDQNNTGLPISFHSGLPATPQNQVDPVVTPVVTTTYYAYAGDPDGCNATIPIEVTVLPSGEPLIPDQSICAADGELDLSLIEDPSFPGGDWEGPGVSGSIFDPEGLSGSSELTYTPVQPCATSVTVVIEVNQVSIPQLETETVCTFGDPVDLNTLSDPDFLPGSWSGPGVDNGTFNPAGLSGQFELAFQSAEDCTGIAFTTINVLEGEGYEISDTTVCQSGDIFALASLLSEPGLAGIWEGPGVDNGTFNPAGLSGQIEVLFTPLFCGESRVAQINIPEESSIAAFTTECGPSNLEYTVSFTIDGSDGNAYVVNGVGIDNSSFTSQPIPSGEPYSFQVSDTAGCWSTLLEGAVDCGCSTNAGTMVPQQQPLEICSGSAFQAEAEDDGFLEPDDVYMFILHDQPGNLVGNVIAVSTDGFFDAVTGLQPGILYYVSRIAGNGDGSGFVDLEDPCLSVAPGTPVIHYEPSLTFAGPEELCGGCGTYTFDFSGQPPFEIWVLFDLPGGNLAFLDTVETESWEVTFCPGDFSISEGSFSVEVIEFSDATCAADVSAADKLEVQVSGLVSELIQPQLCPGDSILINGTWYGETNASGMDTIPNPDGCDTLKMVEVAFLEQAEGIVQQEICPSDTVLVNGSAYHANRLTGAERIIGGAANGCDSLVLVDLTLPAQFTDTSRFEICPGDSLVIGDQVFDGQRPTGTVVFDGAAANGCDSLVYVELRISPFITDTVRFESCGGGTVEVNGVSLDAQNPVADITLPNNSGNGCDTLRHLVLEFVEEITSEYFVSICPGDSVQVGDVVFNEQNLSGSVLFDGAAANGCDSIVFVEITVDSVSYGFFETSVCAGDSVEVHGQVFSAARPDGEVILNHLAANGCDSIVLVSVDFLPSIPGELVQSACAGDTIWVANTFFTEDVIDSSFVLPGAGWQGCDSLVHLALTFLDTFKIIIADTLPVDTIVLINGEQFDRDRTFEVFELQSVNGCDSMVIIDLVFEDPVSVPGVTFTTLHPKCPGQFGSLRLDDLAGDYNLNSLVVQFDGGGTYPVDGLPFLIEGIEPGPYNIVIRDGEGFLIETSFSISSAAFFQVAILASTTVFTGQPFDIRVEGAPEGSEIVWRANGEVTCPNCPETQITSLDTSSFVIVEVATPDGCSVTDSVWVRVDLDHGASGIYIPNIFTPNEDGQNDRFEVFSSAGNTLVLLQVFDRWGQLVFSYTKEESGQSAWNGEFRGMESPAGVYVYFSVIEDENGNQSRLSGNVTLLR